MTSTDTLIRPTDGGETTTVWHVGCLFHPHGGSLCGVALQTPQSPRTYHEEDACPLCLLEVTDPWEAVCEPALFPQAATP